MNRRGVYFFVLDAFIGAAIVLVSLLVVIQTFTSSIETDRPLTILEDFLTYMQNTEVRDFQGANTLLMIQNGTITKPQNTLFNQVSEFYYFNETGSAQTLLTEIANAGLPSQISFRYIYDQNIVYERLVFPYNRAGQVLYSKKLSMIQINRSVIYGPHLVEVVLWTS